MTPCLPLFAGLGTLQRRTPEYHRIHADLVRSYQQTRAALHTKRQRAEIRSRTFKQTGEVHG